METKLPQILFQILTPQSNMFITLSDTYKLEVGLYIVAQEGK